MILDSDVFFYTPRLISINFENNLLFHTGENLLTELRYLSKAYFRFNPCFNDYKINAYGINTRLKKNLPISCSPLSEEESTTNLPPTTVSLGSSQGPEECSAACLEVIDALETRIVEVEKVTKELGVNASSTTTGI